MRQHNSLSDRMLSARQRNDDMIELTLEMQADGIFRRMLGAEEIADRHAADVMRAQRWKTVEPLVKSYFGNTIHLLGRSGHAGHLYAMLTNLVQVLRAHRGWRAA